MSVRKKWAITIAVISVIMILIFAIVGTISNNNSQDDGGYDSGNYGSYNNKSYGNYDDDDYKDDLNDWMADQAEGKDYDYDDGGSYYCMGKGDTCPRKTNNAYDLYCGSCDPDGDNVEG